MELKRASTSKSSLGETFPAICLSKNMEDYMEQELIDQIRKGNFQAFERLYHLYAGFVYNVALRILRNEKDSEEVVQEVFLILYRKIKGFLRKSSLRTFIYRIAVNQAINLYRKRSRQTKYSPVFLTSQHKETDSEYKELAETVLNQLPVEHRLILTLREIEGLSYEEISKVLRVPIGTVKSRLRRARDGFMVKARELLEQEGVL